MKLKRKVYIRVIRPAMLYGAETWATTKRQEKRICLERDEDATIDVRSDTKIQDQE